MKFYVKIKQLILHAVRENNFPPSLRHMYVYIWVRLRSRKYLLRAQGVKI